ncbi:MAG TPA: hypothetical protein VFT53_00270 [Candidatus Saccharimonadales bacterium]|nr:hypothetical protein [Candidatus Saccharimonadales bacterium]
MPERFFSPNDLPVIQTNESGLYAIASRQPGDLLYVGQTADETPLWWKPVPEKDIEQALALQASSTVHSLAMLATYKTLEDGLPITFSQYLTDLRTKNKGLATPCLISADPPRTPTNYVRIPHLVAYEPNHGTILDTIMWELLAKKEAVQWLGSPLPDQQSIEAHLPDLLQLRSFVRTDRLPTTAVYGELKQLLSRRYLSMLFVYQHHQLFQCLFDDKSVAPQPDSPLQ